MTAYLRLGTALLRAWLLGRLIALVEWAQLGEDADDEGEHYPHGWTR